RRHGADTRRVRHRHPRLPRRRRRGGAEGDHAGRRRRRLRGVHRTGGPRMTRVGAIFSPYAYPPEALRDAVVAADEAGLSELWLWEDCFRHSAYASASAALAWTTRLRVGIGIAPMRRRNVPVAATEVPTLARLFPGLLMPGLRRGGLPRMSQVGPPVAPALPT